MNNIDKDFHLNKYIIKQIELTNINFISSGDLSKVVKLYAKLTKKPKITLEYAVYRLRCHSLLSFTQHIETKQLGYRLNREKINEYLTNQRQSTERETS